MRLAIIGLLLMVSVLLAESGSVMLKIERGVNADSVLTEARRIEPRMGEIQISNSLFELCGYRTDSLGADTLRLMPLMGPGVQLIWQADSTM